MEMKTIYFGLNQVPDDKVQEFKTELDDRGCCSASWECMGRTLHLSLANKLKKILGDENYEWDINYDHYKCVAYRKVEVPEFTELESRVINDILHDDFFENGIDSVIWNDVFMDNYSKEDAKAIRGAMGSLVKKDIIGTDSGKDGTIWFTKNGKLILRKLSESDESIRKYI